MSWPTTSKSLQNSTVQLQAQNLFYVDMEPLGLGDPGCRVRLSSYGSKGRVELHVELENRSKRAMALPLGSFTAGSSSSCILAAFLQSLGNDGTWRSAAVLQPRGYATQQTALFLPAFQAVKMPISGKVVNLGRFGGVALRVGGDAPNAAEVLVALGDIGQNGQNGQSQMSKPLVRFTVGKPLKTSRVDTNPVWIGPHEPRQPRRYTTFDTEIVSDVCDLAVFGRCWCKTRPTDANSKASSIPTFTVPRTSCAQAPLWSWCAQSIWSWSQKIHFFWLSKCPDSTPKSACNSACWVSMLRRHCPAGKETVRFWWASRFSYREAVEAEVDCIAQPHCDPSWHHLAQVGSQAGYPGRSHIAGIGWSCMQQCSS